MNPRDRMNSPIFKSWNVIYPIFIYFVATNLSLSLFTMLAAFLGADPEEQYMALQTAAVAVAIPFVANYYRKDRGEPTAFWQHMDAILGRKSTAVRAVNGILMFLAGAAAGIALNNLLIMSSLVERSEEFQQVSQSFFAGGILYELLGACILTPFLEELLYRGVVYARLCDMMVTVNGEKDGRTAKRERASRVLAAVLSALLFGVIHMNLVQFIYAGIFGLLLAWFMEKAGHFYGAFLAHAGANLMAVLRVEAPALSWMKPGDPSFYTATAVSGAACIALAAAIWMLSRKREGI